MDMDLTLDQRKRKRSVARGWLTKSSKALEALCDKAKESGNKAVDFTELEDTLKDFDNRLAALDDIQMELEMFLEPEEMDADQEAAEGLRNEANKVRRMAYKLLSTSLEVDDDQSDSQSLQSLSSSAHMARLPKLELPKFDGKIVE